MTPETALTLALGGIVLGTFILPVEFLPHGASISGRLVLGCLLMIAGGACLGRAFLA